MLWTCLVVSSCILCFFMIYPVYTKWRSNPTITSLESTNYPIWNIDFPAVTVCSNNKVMARQLREAVYYDEP